MDKTIARRWVLVGGSVMLGATLAKNVSTKGAQLVTKTGVRNVAQTTPYNQMWAIGVIMIGLGLVADVAPQIAGPFAMLLALSTLTSGGLDAVTTIASKASSGGGGGGGGGVAPVPPVPKVPKPPDQPVKPAPSK